MKRPLHFIEMSSNKKPNLVESNDIVNNIRLNPINHRKSTPGDLEALTNQLENCETFVQTNACNKLRVVAQQMQALATQAQEIIEETKRNHELNQVACNFVKQPGHIYHLYKKPSGLLYFGMLSPEEWVSCPHEYVDSFRFEFDRTYTPINEINNKDGLLKMLKIYGMDKMLMQIE
nr:uncharacterized protein C1orf50 [Onthophagus taurus]